MSPDEKCVCTVCQIVGRQRCPSWMLISSGRSPPRRSWMRPPVATTRPNSNSFGLGASTEPISTVLKWLRTKLAWMWNNGTGRRYPALATTLAAGTMDLPFTALRKGQPPASCQMAPCSSSPFTPTIAPLPNAWTFSAPPTALMRSSVSSWPSALASVMKSIRFSSYRPAKGFASTA